MPTIPGCRNLPDPGFQGVLGQLPERMRPLMLLKNWALKMRRLVRLDGKEMYQC
jgi:hypothetical protein